MKKLIAALAAFVALATTPALAQEAQPSRKFQLAPYVGAFIPTGDQRDVLDDAVLTGLTLSYDFHPNFGIVGSFGWAASQEVVTPLSDDLDVFQYDLGLQGQYAFELGNGFALEPFVGAGLGGRTYHLHDIDLGNETDFVGYVSGGANLLYRRVALGLTVRDYISAFDGIGTGGRSDTRNDLAVFGSIGVRF